MTRITNADQVLLLLRSHLESAKRAKSERTDRKSVRTGPVTRARELAGAKGLSETDVERALIAGLLSEQFGPELAVEPRFQTMVDEIRQIIERDEAGRHLLKRAVGELTTPQD